MAKIAIPNPSGTQWHACISIAHNAREGIIEYIAQSIGTRAIACQTPERIP
jgi:hypothetical protein